MSADPTELARATGAALERPAAAPAGAPLLEGLSEDAERFARASNAENTTRAYGGAWKRFVAWCAERQLVPMPAETSTVSNFVADRARNHKPGTLRIDLAAIRQAHLLAGHPSPAESQQVKMVISGVRHEKGVRPDSKAALVADPITRFVEADPFCLRSLRDRALLLVGFAGAFRRSELVAVRVEHVRFEPGDAAMTILVPHSKTDQQGEGMEKVIHATGRPTCPVSSLRAWLKASRLADGPVFRSVSRSDRLGEHGLHNGYVAKLAKRVAKAAGLDASAFSGHSLRAGFITEAVARGVDLDEIMGTTGQRSTDVLMGYVRRGKALRTNVTGRVL